jgi:predicted amidohydrolase
MPVTILSDDALGRHRESTSLYDLFLSLYRSLAEDGISEIVRRVFSPWEQARYPEWRNLSHSLCITLINEIGSDPNEWLDDFPKMRDQLLNRFIAWAHASENQQDVLEQQVACVVTALRQLDIIVGRALAFPPGAATYPAPPRASGYSLVLNPGTGFHNRYRLKNGLEPVPPLQHGEFGESLGLVWTYVVEPLAGGQYFDWAIERVQPLVESVWREQMERGELRFAVLSFPHTELQANLEFKGNCFLVKDLGSSEQGFDGSVLKRLEALAEQGGVAVLLFPELTASSALVSGVKARLATNPNRFGLVIPGSRHVEVSPGIWRNSCIGLDPLGRESNVRHDKITRYVLSGKKAEAYGRDPAVETIECIETRRQIRLYDSFTLGRFAVLICRDIIEPPVREFLGRHGLDNIFVLAMTPNLEDFRERCSDLGRELDAGVFVVNTADARPPQPAFLYIPVRGKKALEVCPAGLHQECLHLTAAF